MNGLHYHYRILPCTNCQWNLPIVYKLHGLAHYCAAIADYISHKSHCLCETGQWTLDTIRSFLFWYSHCSASVKNPEATGRAIPAKHSCQTCQHRPTADCTTRTRWPRMTENTLNSEIKFWSWMSEAPQAKRHKLIANERLRKKSENKENGTGSSLACSRPEIYCFSSTRCVFYVHSATGW